MLIQCAKKYLKVGLIQWMTKKRYKLEKAWGIGGQFPHSFLRKAYFPLILFSTLYPSSRENHNLYLDCKMGWQKERREPFVIVFPVFDTWLSCFETRPRIMLIRIDVGSLYPPSGVRLSLETSGQVWDYQMSPRIVSGGKYKNFPRQN